MAKKRKKRMQKRTYKLIQRHTKEIPPISELPYRIICKFCNKNALVASEVPIPKQIAEMAEDIPCSECVHPIRFLNTELARTR